jgi:CMP-N,N'-diacetyllegionaminic acid synthase
MTLLALIPARGGSKGIPRKNIHPFCAKPLLQWSIDVALASAFVDQVVVSTDDPEIADVAKACGAEVPFLRPSELATDTTPGIGPVLHALDQLPEVKDVLLLQPTSPLRSIDDIDSIIKLRQHTGFASAVSLTLVHKHPAWMYYLPQDKRLDPVLDQPQIHCRQQLTPVYVLNGALYLASRQFLCREKTFITTETVGYVMPNERSADIDTSLDLEWAEFLMKKANADALC